MPRLDEGEEQADSEERSPVQKKNARLADLEKAGKKSSHQREEEDLRAPE
jgi:hypothetical protein